MSNLWHQYYVVRDASTIRKMYYITILIMHQLFTCEIKHIFIFWNLYWLKRSSAPLLVSSQRLPAHHIAEKLASSWISWLGWYRLKLMTAYVIRYVIFFLTWTSRVMGPLLSTSKISPFLVPTRMWPWPRDMARMEGLSSKSNPAESVK